MKEKRKRSLPGIPAILVFVLIIVGAGLMALNAEWALEEWMVFAAPAGIIAVIGLLGFYTVEPNQGAVLTFFGKYIGTVKDEGLRWNNPLYAKRKISLRIRNFESGRLKINDKEGSPIEIAAVIVWAVADTAEAVYNVDSYESFVHIQSEAALRAMASSYPYDPQEEEQISLRGHPHEISLHLKEQIADRLGKAGVEVVEARISHLAYAREIAQAMLQRQQANAIIAARTRIVAGAVGMVEMAMAELEKNGLVDLDEGRKAHMVSNLLVVLCGDRGTQPIINAGSLAN